jgi:hypothetical protein
MEEWGGNKKLIYKQNSIERIFAKSILSNN